ncbi:MAG: 2,3-diketo-L-gulonate-binding periplasmic protein YiaO [Myxococcota bacterium]|nr:2,3-diketo-L-gulonate-binding periplasmic protein YiaO [Myxococcota bacterium]
MNVMKKCLPLFVLALLAITSSAFAQDVITIRLGTVAPEGSPWASGLEKFKKMVETDSGGKVKVKLFLGGALGDENDMMLQCKRGQIQAFGGSTGAIASQVPEVNVLELPYLFRNAEEADYILDSVIGDKMAKHFTDRGLVLSFWSENGFRSFGGKFPVTKPEDLKGRKMRSQESPIHLETYRAFGASPVPIPTTEALTSLQTGVVDGYDQTPLYAFAASWFTASKHMSISEHIYQPAAIVFNKEAYDKWPKEVKDAITKAAQEVAPKLRKQIRKMNPILIENLRKAGVEVNVLGDKEREPFIKLAEKVRETYINKASAPEKELYKSITKGLQDLRSGKVKK